MTLDASIWTYPWDLYAEGTEEAMRAMRDEGGLNAVSLTANYHATKALLPHNPRHKVYFNEDGALEFVPRLERYGRLQPRVSRLAREANVWGQAAQAADRLGMKLKAWTICTHNSYLGAAYPDCTIHNAFGDAYLHSLCPAHPDVRAYLVGLTSDLTAQYPVDAVQLESVEYMGFVHDYHHEKIGIALDAWHTFLLDLCFCEHCTGEAAERGVDAEGVRQKVHRSLEAFFDSDLPAPTGDNSMLEATRLALGDPDFRGYLDMRRDVVTSLVGEIKQGMARHSPSTKVLCFATPYGGWTSGGDLPSLKAVADGFITWYSPTGREMASAIKRLHTLLGDDVYLVAGISAILPHTAVAGDVADRVQACLEEGIRAFNFYNYGLMRKASLRAIGRALALGQ